MEYKINIHAHSIFSDGNNSPIIMANKAKELGFTALVLTEHFYGTREVDCGMVKEKQTTYRRAISEAKSVLPVIIGIELPFLGQEVLVFGGSAIKYIFEHGFMTIPTVEHFKENGCAFILCHPSEGFEVAVPYVDGYERHNGRNDMFARERPMCGLEEKQAWHNSDAHSAQNLIECFNVVNKKITNESDLIKHIKKQTPNGCVIGTK